MSQDGKDAGSDEFELDLDFDALDSASKPDHRSKSRERRTTKRGGSHAPPSLDTESMQSQEGKQKLVPPVRHSMIPGPGLDVGDSNSRPTDPGPGQMRARKRTDSTRKIIRSGEKAQVGGRLDQLTEQQCLSRLGSLERIPKIKISEEQVLALGLDHRAGFLYSQIDGLTSLEDLLSISPMSREDSLRIFVKLLEHDAIDLK